MLKKTFIMFILPLLFLFLMTGCLEKMVNPEAKTDTGTEMQLPPYSGPRAKIAVSKFEWKVDQNKGGSTTKISGLGISPITISHSENTGYMTGLRDMLTTAMVQSKRYRVLERQNFDSLKEEMALNNQGYTDESGVTKGGVKGADLLIVAAITGWEPGSSGKSGKLGVGKFLGKAGSALGAIGGSYKKSSLSMDIRMIDAHTSEVLSATRVEGVAKDINIGGALAGLTGSGGMGGGLSSYAKTPMEKAIRTCIYDAVKFIVDNTPNEYMKY